jgi:hypothetical protein
MESSGDQAEWCALKTALMRKARSMRGRVETAPLVIAAASFY